MVQSTRSDILHTTTASVNRYGNPQELDFGIDLVTLLIIGITTFCVIPVFCAIVIMMRVKQHDHPSKHPRKNIKNFTIVAMDHVQNLNLDLKSLGPNKINVVGDNDAVDGCGICSSSSAMRNIKCTSKINDVHLIKGDELYNAAKPDKNASHDEDYKMLSVWLQNTVKLPQYLNALMLAGYNSMQFVKQIQNIEELHEIGIISEDDCSIILKEIEILKAEGKSGESPSCRVVQRDDNIFDIDQIVRNDMEIRGSLSRVLTNGHLAILQDLELRHGEEIITAGEGSDL